MSATLAIDGGAPVRTRGWPDWPRNDATTWDDHIRAQFRDVFLGGVEASPAPRARAFADAFAAYCGTAHGEMMPHGTDSLMAALTAVLDLDGFRDGGEVILPNYTFIATASATLDRRCSIAFVDIDLHTRTMDPNAVEDAVRPGRTVAILPVHLGGHPADMSALREIADRHGLHIIEDCAQAHGAEVDGRKVGSLGDAGAFSFQSSKNLTSGEGGAVTTNDADVWRRVVAFKDCGRHPDGETWSPPRLGGNFRTSEYVATLLSDRLPELEPQTRTRNENAAYLSGLLDDVPGITPPYVAPYATMHGYHHYMLLYDAARFGGRSRDEFIRALNAEGIPAGSGYAQPLADAPQMRHLMETRPELVRAMPCPNAERVVTESVRITHSHLLGPQGDMDDIAQAVTKIYEASQRVQ
jgi:dTDP-4-amino-4,6-dideoxygalactose transaminase